MKLISRLKKMYQLSKKDSKALDELFKLQPEQIAKIPDEDIGDGKAAFFGDPTREDEIEFEREEAGMNKWYKRILK